MSARDKQRPLWALSARERREMYGMGRLGQVGDLLRCADKLEMFKAPYDAAGRMRRAAETIERQRAEIETLKAQLE